MLSVSSSHASVWLSIVPSPGQNLHMDFSEFQVALQWWLGIDLAHDQCCNFYPSHSLDPLGHQTITCKHGWGGGDVVTCHNRLCDVFVESCRHAHVTAQVEAGSGFGHEKNNARPADVLISNWPLGKPAAVDLTIS